MNTEPLDPQVKKKKNSSSLFVRKKIIQFNPPVHYIKLLCRNRFDGIFRSVNTLPTKKVLWKQKIFPRNIAKNKNSKNHHEGNMVK